MRTLHKHPLSFDKAFAYYTEALEGTNAFSDEMLKIVSREKGQFFTLLPDTANLDLLHRFNGSILPEEPKQSGKVGNLPGIHTYSPIASMEEEFAAFLYEQMQTHAYEFMSDDFNPTYTEAKNQEWFKLYGKHYLEEVYYFLSPQNAAIQLIEQCLSKSKTFWHSLSILSKKPSVESKTLQLVDIQEFCKQAAFVLVGAYDGEGHVVWKKT